MKAGQPSRYDHCLHVLAVTSFWRPLSGTAPYQGQPEQLETDVNRVSND